MEQHAKEIITDDFMEWEERDVNSMSFVKHCVAGSCAGIMEHMGLYPVDTLKTHLQASGGNLSFTRTAKILYKDEGVLRFWKGANVIASGVIPAHAGQFLIYEQMKSRLEFKNDEYNVASTMMIGASTTFAHDFFITPCDVIKQRLQLCKNLNARTVISKVWREEGLKGLYRSYPITVFMNIPFSAMVVCVNENMKTLIKPWEKENPHFWYFVCAGVAGGIAGVVTNPLDVVKTRLQTQEITPSCVRLRDMWHQEEQIQHETKNMGKQQAMECSQKFEQFKNKNKIRNQLPKMAKCDFEDKKKVHYRNVFQTVNLLYQQNGAMAFTKGIMPRMLINVPSTALSWGTYEIVKGFLTKE